MTLRKFRCPRRLNCFTLYLLPPPKAAPNANDAVPPEGERNHAEGGCFASVKYSEYVRISLLDRRMAFHNSQMKLYTKGSIKFDKSKENSMQQIVQITSFLGTFLGPRTQEGLV